jgi:hypothetical protein
MTVKDDTGVVLTGGSLPTFSSISTSSANGGTFNFTTSHFTQFGFNPILAEITPVITPTASTSPYYTFSSNVAGTVVFGGDCAMASASTTIGNNTVQFGPLSSPYTYSNCTVKVIDGVGASTTLNVTSFTIATATAPVSAVLSVGSVTPVGGVTNVAIPAAGATDSTGAVTGWVSGTANKIKFTLTDGGSAVSTIKINGGAYTSGNDYTITSTSSLTIIATTTEAGKASVTRTFVISVSVPTQTTPTFSPAAGAITFGSTVTIVSAGADAIYYTTDGSTPTTSSTNQASTPLVINSAITVKALAVKSGYVNSAIGSAAYTQQSSSHRSSGGGSIYVAPVVITTTSTSTATTTTVTATSTATTTVLSLTTPMPIVTVVSTPSTSGYTFTVYLKSGSKGNEVSELQKILVAKGFLVMPKGVAYGNLGPLTIKAIMKFQSKNGLPQTGTVGPLTRKILNSK